MRVQPAQLDELLDDLHGGDFTEGQLRRYGERMGQLLLAPDLREALLEARSSHLAIVHDAQMSQLPWETLRIGTWDQLATPYGVLVVAKLAALVALGCFGALQRTWLIGRMSRPAQRVRPGCAAVPRRHPVLIRWNTLCTTRCAGKPAASGFRPERPAHVHP